ncbi:hypothetical protein CDL15_Pgr004979 [Punica granatum]|nr:hypothetical protein CDL15_Pgr004979 [Punica granatum]
MVFPKEEKLVHSIRLSSVGPGRVTGTDVVHIPSSLDLAMKLHYLRGVYYFSAQATQGLTIKGIKESTFTWLNDYYMTCGRFRRSPDTGRPYMKCNDCGVRFIEGKCDKTIEEWLEMLSEDCELRNLLVSDHVIGPELSFSPPLLIQITQFKCGGFSLSLNWAHILGDVFAVVDFINKWGQMLAGLQKDHPEPPKSNTVILETPMKADREPISVRRVGPVGDHWIYCPGRKKGTFTFHLTSSQLTHLRSKFFGHMKSGRVPPYESLCTILWQCIANVKEEEPKVVTICKNDPSKRAIGVLSNSQKISVVRTDSSIKGSDPCEILGLLVDQAMEETAQIEEAVERDNGVSDFIIYGANLTFLDIGEANLYELELNGLKPIFADYAIGGVGEEGVVLVHPGPKGAKLSGDGGRVVTVILPENLLPALKGELKKNDLLLDENIFS